jgi:multidrug resistance protein
MGLGIGPMLLGPLSEFYGRRPIYIVSFTFFLIWIIPSAVAKNIQTMLIARFLDGLAGSAFLSVAGGTVGDLFNREQLQAPMMIYTASPFVGPSIGPLIGGFINQYTTWRWTFYVLIIWSAVMLGLIVTLVPETYHPVLLRNKARKIRKETGESRWKAPLEKSDKTIARTIAYSLMRPFQLLLLEPMCLNLCLFSAILLGILYLFFGAFGVVFKGNHGFTLSQTGLSFLGIFVGMIAGILTDPLWQKNYMRLIRSRETATGEVGGSEPEYRLPPAILGALLVPVGLFLFAWTTYSSVHWIVPIIGSAVFGMGTLLVFSGIFTFLVDAYPLYAASALAANSFARSSFGAAFPLFGVQMYKKLGDQWATSLLAFLTVAMMPFPYIFFRYGKKIRGKSRFASGK